MNDDSIYFSFSSHNLERIIILLTSQDPNDVIALSFTTATLPPAGDPAWDNAWTNEQFVGSLSEWGYSENQKGIFVAYTKIKIIPFTSIVFNTTGLTSMEFISVIFSLSFGAVRLLPGFLSNMSKLGGSYPDGDNYYYVISADDTAKILGNLFRLETTDGLAEARLTVPLTRYGSP
ncbi:hypothetical protein P0082_02475 [Candidatus Haliotispira prima]|uniref:Uncharacterized protein n=1 Tax=Candidatus Haliotispira prima TaxID=3034016 RepID=A0ABY8MI97_9SPIO|nr:hypothetical protein P0082_02475 [Candidatus Haliotispira prima]